MGNNIDKEAAKEDREKPSGLPLARAKRIRRRSGTCVLASENCHASYDAIVAFWGRTEEDTIADLAQLADLGVTRALPKRRVLLILVGCESGEKGERTQSEFLNTNTLSDKECYLPRSGKDAPLRYIFQRASEVGASCAMYFESPDVESFSADWVHSYAEALSLGYDAVAPRYLPHRFVGTIADLLAYPVLHAVFRRSVRQPMGGDLGFSSKLLKACLDSSGDWPSECAEPGNVSLFALTTASARGLALAEVPLPFKALQPPVTKLGPVLHNMLQLLLRQVHLEPLCDRLQEAEKPEPVPRMAGPPLEAEEPDIVTSNPDVFVELSRTYYEQHRKSIDEVAPEELDVEDLVRRGSLDAVTWARLIAWAVQECADAEDRSRCAHLLVVCFLLRAPSHIKQVSSMTNEEAEKLVLSQADLCFQAQAQS